VSAVIAAVGLILTCFVTEAVAVPPATAWVAQAPAPDPLSSRARWRDAVIKAPLTPPAVTAGSPLLVLITSAADLSHPEFRGANVTNLADAPVNSADGTAAASIAAAPANGVGILGIWPGMRVAVSPLPATSKVGCEAVTKAFEQALDAGAAVIVAGYGFDATGEHPGAACFSEFIAVQEAVRRGILVVASGPMRRPDGTVLGEPATLPHVVSVAASGADRFAAEFTRESLTTDLAAPGVGILAAVPPAFDENGDGYRALSGTGFAAPMVGAAAAWLLAARPGTNADQVATALRHSTQDLDDPGRDGLSGWGMLDVAGALAVPLARADAPEPNEDVQWIDGSLLDRPQPALRSGGPALFGRLDRYEDPVDVYRLRVRHGAHARVRLRAADGDPALALYDARTRSVRERRHRVARSDRPGRQAETVLARNPGRRMRTLFVQVTLSPRADTDTATYRLTVSPVTQSHR
jgi:hypothetical protein